MFCVLKITKREKFFFFCYNPPKEVIVKNKNMEPVSVIASTAVTALAPLVKKGVETVTLSLKKDVYLKFRYFQRLG